ncbi:uncharacterized protein EV154DRAFT_112788 [Mucor mucedo]|uniref:uncharacterized protein n=1 Tax=Mucor mucedo TaxID=29922 RepID=UPI00221ECE03|nr:uncharacterized protein EV154DRAFT_112788 [Mucor mucedo]KAI7871124.1 hypothetical protein EV154DRAFT_112788 [Mucor mucedo]
MKLCFWPHDFEFTFCSRVLHKANTFNKVGYITHSNLAVGFIFCVFNHNRNTMTVKTVLLHHLNHCQEGNLIFLLMLNKALHLSNKPSISGRAKDIVLISLFCLSLSLSLSLFFFFFFFLPSIGTDIKQYDVAGPCMQILGLSIEF